MIKFDLYSALSLQKMEQTHDGTPQNAITAIPLTTTTSRQSQCRVRMDANNQFSEPKNVGLTARLML